MKNEQNFVIERIGQLLKEYNWTIYRLAKESELSYSSLNNIFIRNTVPSVYSLEKICNGFRISLAQFFDDTTQITVVTEPLNAEERNILETYRILTRNDKKLFKAYLNGLAKKLPDEL